MIRRHPVVATLVAIPLVLTLSLATLVSLWLAGVQIPGASAARWFTITKTANADYTPSPDKPVFLLRVTPELRAFIRLEEGGAVELFDILREDTLRLFLERYSLGSGVG